MPREKRTTIEINGRLYDAVSGKLLEQAPSPKPTSEPKPKSKLTGKAMDGFVNHPKPATDQTGTGASVTQRKIAQAKNVHHRTKRSQTLNRSVVTPPKHNPPQVKSDTNQVATSNSKHSLSASVRPTRKARAAGVTQSRAISKFGSSGPVESPAPAEVKAPTEQPTQTEPAPNPTAPTSYKNELIARQLARVSTNQDNEQPKSADRSGGRFGDWVAKKRLSSLVATSLAAVLLIGYVTYLNIPRIALRVAAGRAGFEAQMPSYSPSGFAFSGPVAYSPGQITIQFSSNTDGRAYTITERETNWDSQSLLANHVLSQTDLYSTYQERGLTVYVYEGSNAAWVNGGIWYTVEGESALSAEQLLKIAASL